MPLLFYFFTSKSLHGSGECFWMWLSNSTPLLKTPSLTLTWFFSAAIECFLTVSPCLSSTGFGASKSGNFLCSGFPCPLGAGHEEVDPKS